MHHNVLPLTVEISGEAYRAFDAIKMALQDAQHVVKWLK